MNILIIGGTRFLGRALVNTALTRGHKLTLFNRGKSNPDLFPDVETITGDRNTDLHLLEGRTWDAVIDTCGFEPGVVRKSVKALAGSAGQYTFISSISAYADFNQRNMDESAPTAQLAEGEPETFKIENYGPLKVLCELAAEEAFPGRALNVRPGLIVGEYDASDRFTYWPWRVSQGGEVLAPDRPEHPIQFIDVRDLADWTILAIEEGRTGYYNLTGPNRTMTFGELLDTSKRVSGSDASYTWVNEAFLLENKIEPWADLPLWLPAADPAYVGMDYMNIDKAVAHGLTFRPLEDTVRSTLAWEASRPADHPWRAGITREREAELLEKWKAR